MTIIDRLPITDRPGIINVQGDLLDIYRNQIIVWVSIGDPRRVFPAILDTGHSHNFSSRESHLSRWSGVTLPKIGELEIGRERVDQYAADIYVHHSVRGRLTGKTSRLQMPQGISIFSNESAQAPRLPLVGLKSLISNRLRLIVDGARREASLQKVWKWRSG
jgi:hypothetical protein